ncbi:universal stress protein [Isoptericola sp. NEAU-Y5]|uniref:Universal stress protein n=1 Tax=Isoptericola luteus TaxID=2879484 RepID=A0ABS7ZJT3_9MICO|nr:universal stress protein [Isoptericola sp. NEAU-Y5]MCA5893874.1 universal stress protein [Isoptericola sp. NEAU-Y5]
MSIVVGLLSTAEGQAALTQAVTEARERAVPLRIVVTRPDADPAELDAVRARMTDAGVEHHLVPGSGDLADDLVRTAADAGAQLIVVGLRRRSPVGKLILGSGAQRILLEAPCPVLAVKP